MRKAKAARFSSNALWPAGQCVDATLTTAMRRRTRVRFLICMFLLFLCTLDGNVDFQRPLGTRLVLEHSMCSAIPPFVIFWFQKCRGDSGWCLDVTSTHGAWRQAGVRFLLRGDITAVHARVCNSKDVVFFMLIDISCHLGDPTQSLQFTSMVYECKDFGFHSSTKYQPPLGIEPRTFSLQD